MRGKHISSNLLLFLCGLFMITGCEDSFQPLKENTLYNFNISGYLDAAADTQWIRVGTIRESIDEPPDPTGINVTLENLQTGESVIMKDSVFTSQNVLNYWTTMDIKSEETYRITAEDPNGKSSDVTLTTPSVLPSVYITVTMSDPAIADIYIDESPEQIVDVQSVWYVLLKSGTEMQKRIFRFSLRNTLRTSNIFGDSYTFANLTEEQQYIEQSIGNAEISRTTKQFFVAVAGPEWNNNLSAIDDLEYFLDETGSNAENGLGYVIGIHSGWFRQITCLNKEKTAPAPCDPEKPYW